MKPLALGVAINVLLLLLALIAYDRYARVRELRVAVVDVAAVYRWKEAQFTALLTQPGTDARAEANAPQLAAEFARELPQALDDIAPSAAAYCSHARSWRAPPNTSPRTWPT